MHSFHQLSFNKFASTTAHFPNIVSKKSRQEQRIQIKNHISYLTDWQKRNRKLHTHLSSYNILYIKQNFQFICVFLLVPSCVAPSLYHLTYFAVSIRRGFGTEPSNVDFLYYNVPNAKAQNTKLLALFGLKFGS